MKIKKTWRIGRKKQVLRENAQKSKEVWVEEMKMWRFAPKEQENGQEREKIGRKQKISSVCARFSCNYKISLSPIYLDFKLYEFNNSCFTSYNGFDKST